MGADDIFISNMGVGEWVRGRLAGLAQRGCSTVFETAQYHPTLPVIIRSDNAVQSHPTRSPGLTGGSLWNCLRERSLEKAL